MLSTYVIFGFDEMDFSEHIFVFILAEEFCAAHRVERSVSASFSLIHFRN